MEGDSDLAQIYEELVTQQWSSRSVPCGIHIDETRGLVVVATVPLLEEERAALMRIGGSKVEVDETADPRRR